MVSDDSVCADPARGLDGGGVPPSGRQPADHPRQGSPDLLDQTQGRLLREDRHHQASEFREWVVCWMGFCLNLGVRG